MSITAEERAIVAATAMPAVTSRRQLQKRYLSLISEEIATLRLHAHNLGVTLTPSPGPLPEVQVTLVEDEETKQAFIWPIYWSNAGGTSVNYDKLNAVNMANHNYDLDARTAETMLTLTNGSPDKIWGLVLRLRAATAWAIEQGEWRGKECVRLRDEMKREEERRVRALMEEERESLGLLEAALAYRSLAKPD